MRQQWRKPGRIRQEIPCPCVGNQLIVSYNITGKLFVSRFQTSKEFRLSVLSIILADLLGNRCSFQRVQKVMVCKLWYWWISIRFYFRIRCLWSSCFGQLSTCLLWFWSFLRNVFLGLTCRTCNTKAKSTSFPREKYHRNFLCYLNEW